MTSKKQFDCMEMKNAIQAKLAQKHAGLTDAEIRVRIEEKLATSNNPVARKWRAIVKQEQQSQINR